MTHSCCRDVVSNADRLVEGEAGGEAWTALREHLAMCPPCQEYVRQLGLTIEVLRALPGRAGDDARAELMRRFEAWSRSRGA